MAPDFGAGVGFGVDGVDGVDGGGVGAFGVASEFGAMPTRLRRAGWREGKGTKKTEEI